MLFAAGSAKINLFLLYSFNKQGGAYKFSF